jgi:hypothetical protein
VVQDSSLSEGLVVVVVVVVVPHYFLVAFAVLLVPAYP